MRALVFAVASAFAQAPRQSLVAHLFVLHQSGQSCAIEKANRGLVPSSWNENRMRSIEVLRIASRICRELNIGLRTHDANEILMRPAQGVGGSSRFC
jgi:hypothetical protein